VSKKPSGEDMDYALAKMVQEYEYRQLFHITHDQYLDEPSSLIRWMIAINKTFREAANG